MKFQEIFVHKKPVIGMIHLPPLLGYPEFRGVDFVVRKALRDLKSLEAGRIDGVMVENEEDHPHQVTVGPEIVTCFTKVMLAIAESVHVPFGLQVLLNDPKASLSIAKVSGASYIRTDYFVDKMEREGYGEMKIDPCTLMELRRKIKAQNIAILADIQVKYAKMLEKKDIVVSAKQAIQAGADAIITTGKFSGDEPEIGDLRKVKKAVGDSPVLIGSGLSKQNAKVLLSYSDGAIVGTALKANGDVSQSKTRNLMNIVREIRKE